MRGFVQRSLGMFLGLALVACGGSQSKGGGDEKSDYDQLASMSGDIDTSINALMTPIDGVDAIVAALEELPAKYKIPPEEARELVRTSLTGGPITLPAALDDTGKAELGKFLGDLTTFKNALVATPDNATAFAGTLGESLVKLPKLVAGVSAETSVVKGNPLASPEAKAQAEQKESDAKQLQTQLNTKISESQSRVAEIPAKAAGAIGKLGGALSKLGIENADAFLKAGQQTADDTKKAATDAVDNTTEAAKQSAGVE